MERLDVRLLGRFEVAADGRRVGGDAWQRRRAADLVKLLALAPSHRLTREQVVDALWPHLDGEAGLRNLHRAAHYARRALGSRDAVVLRRGLVELAPAARLETDVERFEAGDEGAYGGELLPDDRYEEWAVEPRERLRARRQELLRATGRWAEVLREDPADEEAHRELMRAAASAGDRLAAARQFRSLRDELARLGLQPSEETIALHSEISRGPAVRDVLLLDAPVEGRDRELAAVREAMRAAAGGRGGALLLLGDPGMGKTRIAEVVLADGERRGWHTLRGVAHDEEGPVAYGPVMEALEALLLARPDLVAGLADRTQEVLGLLSPAVPRRADGGEGRAAERHELLAGLGQLLAAAARERGVVVVLEDLHAADEATLHVVHYLARVARRERMVLVASARPGEVSPGFVRVRASLRERRAAVDVVLAPLSAAATRRIAGRAAKRSLPAETAGAIEAAAAGNPFFAEELAAAVDPTGRVRVPEQLHDLLDARIARLPAEAAAVVPVLAVLQDGFGTVELATLAGIDESVAAAALDAGVRARILERTADGVRFRHPLLRDAARRRLSPDRLARANIDAAVALAGGGAAPERVAYHWLEAGRGREAVPLLEAAARQAAAVGAYADGQRWVEQALGHADASERGELLALLGDLRFATGDRRAAAAFGEALTQAPPSRLPDLQVRQARALLAGGHLDGAERALAGVPGGTVAQRAAATVTRGVVAWYRGDLDEAGRRADQAASLVAAAGVEQEQLADLQAMLAHADGRWERHTAWQLGEAWHVPELAGRVFDAYLCVTEYVLHTGDPYDRLAAFARGLHEQARRAGARRGEAFSATVLGEAELLGGDPEAAREHLAQATTISREVGAVSGEALARARLGEALLELGDRLGARAQLDEALELAHVSTLARHVLFLVYAPLLRLTEDPDEALVLLDGAEVVLEDQHGCRFCPVGFHVAAAMVCARAGELARARAFLQRAEEGAALWPGGPWRAAIAEALGELRRAEGAWQPAARALRRAAEGYAAAGQRLHEQRARRALTALSRD